MAGDIELGLTLVDQLARDDELPDYHLLDATRADLLRRRGEREGAAAAYRAALAGTPS